MAKISFFSPETHQFAAEQVARLFEATLHVEGYKVLIDDELIPWPKDFQAGNQNLGIIVRDLLKHARN